MTSEHPTSRDSQEGAEAFEQTDEAFDEATNLDASFLEAVEQDPSIDPANQLDQRELSELESQLDDPEEMVTLSDGSDDPDGLGGPSASAVATRDDKEGWDLDEPLTSSDDSE
jgi:hypothetical protein